MHGSEVDNGGEACTLNALDPDGKLAGLSIDVKGDRACSIAALWYSYTAIIQERNNKREKHFTGIAGTAHVFLLNSIHLSSKGILAPARHVDYQSLILTHVRMEEVTTAVIIRIALSHIHATSTHPQEIALDCLGGLDALRLDALGPLDHEGETHSHMHKV